jgi:hypothetical protein
MRFQSFELSQGLLKEDMMTYIPVNASLSTTRPELFDLFHLIENFLDGENKQSVVLIHGNAGSGKSLFGRYLQLRLWRDFEHGDTFIPVFISLPALKDPIRQAIKGTLTELGFTDGQIQKLKFGKEKLLFILDGFDEIQSQDNIYQQNDFVSWTNCKVIITARTEYLLGLGNYAQYFKSDRAEALLEYYIKPFDATQQESFFAKIIEKGLSEWNEAKQYLDAIGRIPGLTALANNPFMLRILASILPTLTRERESSSLVTRAIIYYTFIEREFQISKDKLYSLKDKTVTVPADFDPVNSFWKFSMLLATNMFVRGTNSIMTYGDDYRFHDEMNDFWDQFFNNKDTTLTASRFGAPLIKVGRQRAFRHKSLLEYFTARMMIKELNDLLKTRAPMKATAYLNQRALHEEPSIIQFVLEILNDEKNLTLMLWRLLKQSKTDPHIAIAAGNAMTLLVRRKEIFQGKNLSQIHLKFAAVDFGNFEGVNFSGAFF